MKPDLTLHKNTITNELKDIYFICNILVDIFTVIPDMIDVETAFQVIEAIGKLLQSDKSLLYREVS